MENGAVEVLAKPGGAYSVGEMGVQLVDKIRAAARIRITPRTQTDAKAPAAPPQTLALTRTTQQIVAIGASTGGTEALKEILIRLPSNFPGTVVVQHMPPKFTTAFAERLNGLCQVEVKEAADGDSVLTGKVLIAPGNFHMLLKRSGARYFVQVKNGPMVHHQRPSVDVLFNSTAQTAGANALGVILTGMGADGAAGLLAMKKSGARTYAQDEASCVVFGMPKEAIKLGGVDKVLPLSGIPHELIRHLSA
jgi:two-component system chemotaxis response regulator CheB